MPKTGRKILFFFFVAGFLVIAPLVVLYTAGFRYSLGAGRFVQTGILSATSVPKDTRLFIDNELLNVKTPALVKNIIPGEHIIRLEKDGYFPWTKRLSFYSRITTFITKAVLFLDEPAERVQDIRIGASAALQDKQKIAYAKLGEKAQEVWIFNADGTETMVARMPSISIAPKIEWSADGSFLSIQTPLRNGVSTWLIDATNGASIELPFSFQKDGWWDATADNRYYITTASGVSLFDLTRRTATPLPKGTVAATSDNDQFLLLQSTPQGLALAHHSILDPLGTRILAHLPFGSYRFLPAPSGIILLEEIGRHGLVLLTRFGDEARAGLHTTAVLWQWEPNGQRLLYSDGFDLHLYRPDRDEDTTITRQSRRITSLAWHPEGSAIIFMQEDGLYGMELDTRDILNTVKLETGDGFESLLVDNDGKNAYFIGTVNGVSGLFRRVLQK